jgi:WhiB family redox-sensing transcriptional regulator
MVVHSLVSAEDDDGVPWQSWAACLDSDAAAVFDPGYLSGETRHARTAAAKAVCARCTVLEQCRAHALAVAEPHGIWGGLDEVERTTMITALRRTPGPTP